MDDISNGENKAAALRVRVKELEKGIRTAIDHINQAGTLSIQKDLVALLADFELVAIPRVTLDRFLAMEQAAIGALHRSCIGCAGALEYDREGWTPDSPALHHETVGPEVRTRDCTADPILRDAVADLASGGR